MLGHALQELYDKLVDAVTSGDVFSLKPWLLSKHYISPEVKDLLNSGQHEAARDFIWKFIMDVDT